MLIRVTTMINACDLTSIDGSADLAKSAEELAEWTADAWQAYLSNRFRDARVEMRVRAHHGEHTSNNIVVVEFGEPVSRGTRCDIEANLNLIALEVHEHGGWVAPHTVAGPTSERVCDS